MFPTTKTANSADPQVLREWFLHGISTLIIIAVAGAEKAAFSAEVARSPNIVLIIADELGYFEPSYMGNAHIRTPNIDRMAAEGIRFTQCMAGSCVCAPTRCCYLTGKHSGHTSVRSNGGGTPLRADEQTVASVLKPLGYATGGFGKWGNGGRGSTGVPEKHGFDLFVGYYDQVHAHSYYPPYLIRNSEELPLAGNRGGTEGDTYSQYAIVGEAVKFIRANKDRPFLCYLPFTPPHGNFDIPDDDPAWATYKDQTWAEPAKRYAAMVTMLDRQIGEILAILTELKLDDNTLVMFSGDNGGNDYFPTKELPRGVHGANKNPSTGAEFRGKKGTLYEGGLRVPALARWPGKIAPGRTSDLLCYFPDVLPTIAEATGAKAPSDVDGISLLPELLGEATAGRAQKKHEYLYWEIGAQTAVRMENWKAIQPSKNAPWELYDLGRDISESHDLSKTNPDMLSKLQSFAAAAHTPAVEGTFESTELHERDRAAKFGGNSPPPKDKQSTGAVRARPTAGALPNKDWKIVRASSENAANGKFARNAIDGDPTTLWHTKFTDGAAQPPHELVIDLGAELEVRALAYLARQDVGWNGAAKEIEFCIGQSPDRFAKPVASATLLKTKERQVVKCPATKGRYVLLRILSEQSGNAFASVAELEVIGE